MANEKIRNIAKILEDDLARFGSRIAVELTRFQFLWLPDQIGGSPVSPDAKCVGYTIDVVKPGRDQCDL
jgi:hypothetical protein